MNSRLLLPGICLLISLTASASVRYVDLNSASPAAPYESWATAATTIQDAIDVASAGDEIVVTNGIYLGGGRAIYGTMTNRVAVDKAVTLRSVNGPQFTHIQGRLAPGTVFGGEAVRCVYLTNGASLTGFTLTNGATHSSGNAIQEMSGGGVWCNSTSAIVSRCIIAAMKNYVAWLEKKAEDSNKDEKEGKNDGVAGKPYSTEATKEFLELVEKNERKQQGR